MDEKLLLLLKVVAKNIRNLRKDLGLSQEKLAKSVGISRGYLARIETDSASPSLETLDLIAQALGVKISDIFPTQTNKPMTRGERITALLSNLGGEDAYFVIKRLDDTIRYLIARRQS